MLLICHGCLINVNNLKYLNLLNFTINCSTDNMLTFEGKGGCEFISNNQKLKELYYSN